MTVVDPRVSTASRFFTNTFFEAIFFAVKVKETVTVASRPSGTLATMIPIQKTRFLTVSVPLEALMIKKVTPRMMATAEIMWIKCSISMAIGVFTVPVDEANLAILPMTVLSPVAKTIPSQLPETHKVP
jgi:hypothetical protein